MSAHSEDVHVHLHIDPLRIVLQQPRKPGQPVTAILTIGGSIQMPASISIDDTTSTAKLSWVDDKGDTDAKRPDGAQVTFASTDPSVATVAVDDADADLAHIAPVAEGSAQLAVTIADASGNPLLEPDGVTAFSVAPADFTIVAGQAVGASLEIKSS